MSCENDASNTSNTISGEARKGPCLLYPQDSLDSRSSRLQLHRHPTRIVPTKHEGTDIVVSSNWQTSEKTPTNVSMAYRIDLFPNPQIARDGKLDRLQESLTSLVNDQGNREIIDRELLLGGHRSMHNTVDESRKSNFPPPIHRDTMLLESSANLARVTRHLYNTAQAACSGAQVSESRFCYTVQQGLAGGGLYVLETDDLADKRHVRYLSQLPSVPGSEFFSVDWENPSSTVRIHNPTGQNPTKHRHWYDICAQVGEPTGGALSELEKLRKAARKRARRDRAKHARSSHHQRSRPRSPFSTAAIPQLADPPFPCNNTATTADTSLIQAGAMIRHPSPTNVAAAVDSALPTSTGTYDGIRSNSPNFLGYHRPPAGLFQVGGLPENLCTWRNTNPAATSDRSSEIGPRGHERYSQDRGAHQTYDDRQLAPIQDYTDGL